MNIFCREKTPEGLGAAEIKAALLKSLEGRTLNNVLTLPPDFTRFHSNAGLITQIIYHELTSKGCKVDIMPALGTHVPVSKEQWEKMFGDIPYDKMIVHNWRTDVEKIGEVPEEYLEEITDGLWHDSVSVEINRRVMDEKYDLMKHPNIALSTAGGAAPYEHGLAPFAFDPETIILDDESYVVLSSEEIQEMLEEEREKQYQERQEQNQHK